MNSSYFSNHSISNSLRSVESHSIHASRYGSTQTSKKLRFLRISLGFMILIISINFMMNVYASNQENTLLHHTEPSNFQANYSTHISNPYIENKSASTFHVADNIVVVQLGDSLWTIASSHKPQSIHTHAYIQAIIIKNQLDSSQIKEGQVLRLP